MKIGFVVNPIAGMGGKVGLKGTDGVLEEARKRGAEPLAGKRAIECLDIIKAGKDRFEFITVSGAMGADLLGDFKYTVCYKCQKETSSEDTKAACAKFVESQVNLILFCGGDGTARDVYSTVYDNVPVLGIPAGVKMHSSVFGVSPQAAGELVLDMLRGEVGMQDSEVMDVDEDAYRNNELKTRLYGYMQTPFRPELIQAAKMIFESTDDNESKFSISVFASEFMADGSTYILGAGSTTKAIADRLKVEKTLLGVDVIKGDNLLLKDADEKGLLSMLDTESKVKIIVSPIGAQGFVFGRGTQQISPQVIRKVGSKNIIYVATPSKLNSTPHLLVDTGDKELDKELSGYRSVVIGYRLSQRKDIKAIGLEEQPLEENP
jgi:predicted polyphosphate/ATP-dependent NAD kinase